MSVSSAIDLIESVKNDKVIFVGDQIIDEYHYVRPLGKSPKEYLIPTAFQDKESFSGGVDAAAKHAESFCGEVAICRSPNPVRKVRYVDETYLRKLFEVHYDELLSRCHDFDGEYDAWVVTDFGHDRVSGEMIGKLVKKPFLAVNAQTNSSNIGFNLITKYPRADYIVIDEPEARLAAADRESHIQDVIERLAHGRCGKFVVTRGKNGAIGYENGRFFERGSKTDFVRDTMGAGDAFFAVTAPMARTGDMEDLLAIGNAAGALKTQIVGHRAPVTKQAVIEYLRAHGTD